MMFQLRKKPCAFEKLDWEIDKRNFSCTSSINVYHCIQDERNRSGEICIQPVWVQPHYCPEFNTGARALDTVPCNVTKGCPDVTFLSDEAYKYPVCLNKTHKKEILENGDSSVPSWFWIVVPTVVLGIVILVLSAACLVWRRKRKDQNDENRDQPLLDLEDEFEKSKPFHKTAAFHEAIRYLKNDGKLLVLIGIWGSGKTKTAKEVYRMYELRSTPCAFTKSDWEKDKNIFKTCLNPINVYHCIQDERNRSGEICIQPVWVQPRKCPEFNTGAWVLDTVPCNAATGCPNVTFLSNEAYKYPVCLNKTHTKV
uniref:Uncharacterized protein LOC111108172 isoform X2 n=1 Tax=Crassostrea virginica TaxID=6565 RepID=A0A8B8B7W6_CRAVI|nr:uncharacterized protein LOC111108172 isoform X2 [Crassostrea virginica]